jgi:hypothetical protein
VSRPDDRHKGRHLYLPLAMSAEPYSKLWMRRGRIPTSLFSVLKHLVLKMRISQVMAWCASPDAVLDTEALPEVYLAQRKSKSGAPEMRRQMLLRTSIYSVPTVRLILGLSDTPP